MKSILNLFIIFLFLWSCNPNADQVKSPNEENTEKQNQKKSVNKVDAHSEESANDELSEDKIQSLKVAYFTKELNLTPQEAEKFWPIYNKHTKIYKDLGDTEWEAIKKGLREVNTYNESDAEKLLLRYKEYLKQRLDNRFGFIDELETVISPKKIMLLKHAEYNFNKKLLKQYRSGEVSTK